MKIKHLALLATATLLLLAAACGDDDEAGVDDDRPTPSGAQTIATSADIRGQITERTDGQGDTLGTILIEGASDSDTNYDLASVRIDNETEITGPNGEALSWNDLIPGTTVEATFEGPVAESYPVQAYASQIAILHVFETPAAFATP